MFSFIHLTDTQLKYVVVTVVSILSFAGCFTPKFHVSRQRCPLGMSAALCFGAGVLFETASLHIYTEAQISLPDVSPVVYCISFIFLYTADEIFHFCFNIQWTCVATCKSKAKGIIKKLNFWKSQSQAHLLPAYDQTSFDSESAGSNTSEDTIILNEENSLERSILDLSKSKSYGTMSGNDNTGHTNHDIFVFPSTSKEMTYFPDRPQNNKKKLSYSKSSPSLSSLSQPQGYYKRRTSLHPCFPASVKSIVPTTSSVFSDSALSERDRILERRLSMQQRRQECHEYNEISDIDTNTTLPPPGNSPVGHLGLLLGLSIHSILEGIPIGIEDVEGKVLLLTGAVASHKLVIAICLGMELANMGSRWPWVILQSLMFSLTLPGGALLGEMVKNYDDTFNTLIAPIMQAVAGGAILYVALCEVLPRERFRWQRHKTRKAAGIALLLSFAAGFITMYCFGSLITYWGNLYSNNYSKNHQKGIN